MIRPQTAGDLQQVRGCLDKLRATFQRTLVRSCPDDVNSAVGALEVAIGVLDDAVWRPMEHPPPDPGQAVLLLNENTGELDAQYIDEYEEGEYPIQGFTHWRPIRIDGY